MARLAKFSDAMSSMDVNCVRRGRGDGVEAGTRRRERVSIRRARAWVSRSLAQRFRTRIACLTPLLLGDKVRHLAVDLLERLKPRMGFDHRSHGAASVEYEAVRSAYERYSYERPRSNG